jgi:hypothetical protein
MKKAVITKCLFLVLFIFIMKLSFNSQWLQRRNLVLESTDQENLEAEFWLQKINGSDHAKNLVSVIDLNSHLLPRDLYKPIKCRKSNMYIVRTTLCVHDLERDVHVRKSNSYFFLYNKKKSNFLNLGIWIDMAGWCLGRTHFK